MTLSIHNLSKSYGTKKALTDFSAEFGPGVTAILGPNGAGKTTLMSLIADLLKRDSGEILYDGTDILKLGSRFRERLGFMPQSPGMYDNMSARSFLAYMAELKGLSKHQARTEITELLSTVGLEKEAHRKLGGFSGGMKQRVMLAQALLGNPEVLLLDEMSAGLDPEERVRMREYISGLGKDRIILLSTHIISDVETIADRIILLSGGRITADLGTEEFVAGTGSDKLEDAYIRRLHDE